MYIINTNNLPYVGQTGVEVNLAFKIKITEGFNCYGNTYFYVQLL